MAGRVVRRVEDDRLGPRRERPAQLVGVERPVRRAQRHPDRLRPGEERVGAVVLVEGLEDDDLVAGVDQGEHGRHHALGRAAADGDVLVGVAGDAVERPDLAAIACRRAAPPGDGVLVEAVLDRPAGGVLDLLRRLEVGHALAEVERPVLGGQPGHLADDRFGEMPDTRG